MAAIDARLATARHPQIEPVWTSFDSSIQGDLEGAELLMPIIAFLGLSSTQSIHGHVGTNLALDMQVPRIRRHAVMATLLISILICAAIGAPASPPPATLSDHRISWLHDIPLAYRRVSMPEADLE